MIFNKKYLIGEELVRRGLITQEQLDEGIIYHQEKQVRVGKALMELGFITEDALIEVLADQLGVPFVDFASVQINSELLSKVPAEIAREYSVFPVKYENEALTVCVADPLNFNLMYELQSKLNAKLLPAIASASAIGSAISTHYGSNS